MEEFMFQNGKMPVVIAVVLLILLGIFAYLFIMERRIGRLERDMKKDSERKAERSDS